MSTRKKSKVVISITGSSLNYSMTSMTLMETRVSTCMNGMNFHKISWTNPLHNIKKYYKILL